MANGDNKDLWIEFNNLREAVSEIRAIVKTLPDKINYYNMNAIKQHEENCKADGFITDFKIEIAQIKKDVIELQSAASEAKKDKSFWKDKGIVILLAILIPVIMKLLKITF